MRSTHRFVGRVLRVGQRLADELVQRPADREGHRDENHQHPRVDEHAGDPAEQR